MVFGRELRCWNRRRRDGLHVDWRALCVSHLAYLKNRTLKLSYLLLVMGRAFESLDDLPYDSKHMSRTGVNIIATAVRCLDGCLRRVKERSISSVNIAGHLDLG